MPEDGISLGPNAKLLSFSEIETLARLFVQHGVRKIRITGGEPLVRPEVEQLFEMLGAIKGVEELGISTNGALLTAHLPSLLANRVHHLNISLDTLRPDRFRSITGRDEFEAVNKAIRSAVEYRVDGSSFASVKVNMVVMRGTNDDEVLDFVRFGEELAALAHGGPAMEIRFIEFMPFPGNEWNAEQSIPWRELLSNIEQEFSLRPVRSPNAKSSTAKSFEVQSLRTQEPLNFRIGFITTVSEHFCAECSRLRLTADGEFRACLFGQDGVNLRDMLRRGETPDAMATAITRVLKDKWPEHPPVHELAFLNNREMISIGG